MTPNMYSKNYKDLRLTLASINKMPNTINYLTYLRYIKVKALPAIL